MNDQKDVCRDKALPCLYDIQQMIRTKSEEVLPFCRSAVLQFCSFVVVQSCSHAVVQSVLLQENTPKSLQPSAFSLHPSGIVNEKVLPFSGSLVTVIFP